LPNRLIFLCPAFPKRCFSLTISEAAAWGEVHLTAFLVFEFFQEIDGAAQMGNYYRAADNQGDTESFKNFGPAGSGFLGLEHMVGDAIIAAQHQGYAWPSRAKKRLISKFPCSNIFLFIF
jgi:hypothetical protein